MRYVVALYEIDRAYGGPEEGGWWYDTGVLARPLRVCPSEAAAAARAARANRLLDRLQRGHREVGPLLYEGVRPHACVFANTAPDAFPPRRPHYE